MAKLHRLRDFDYLGCYRYFVTIRCQRGQPFTDHTIVAEAAAILKETSEESKFAVWAYCFMPDHVHMLIEGRDESADMRQFVFRFKQKSGHRLQHSRSLSVWQRNYYERVLRDDESVSTVARYILQNPVRKGLAEDYASYPYSGSFELADISQVLV